MPIDYVEVSNFRSIRESGRLRLGPITLLVGENNAGKSSLLRALHMVQAGASADDIRIGSGHTDVRLSVTEPYPTAIRAALWREQLDLGDRLWLTAHMDHESGGIAVQWPTDSQRAERGIQIPSQRPDHLAVPFFSRRKSAQYETTVRRDLAQEVDTTDRNLTSRIANLATGAHPAARRYRELVAQVLGLEVTTFLSDDGQVPGQAVGPGQGISLMRMGEGVSSVVGILTELAVSGRRLFLIEEPENDLHPKSLRALLDVLKEEASSEGHQFVITTHSDTVLRALGGHADTQIYRVEGGVSDDGIPLSTYHQIAENIDREAALLELGYEQTAPFGWLLLEESSGETFVRDVIIPLFVPRLAILRTVSSGGAGNLRKRLDGLNSMLLFAHLSSETHRAWVIADGDAAGREAISALETSYPSWPSDRFQTFALGDIEDFYPDRFAEQVGAIANEGDGRRAKRLKGELAQQVRAWAVTDIEAVAELEVSARQLIEQLRLIEASVARS